LFFVILFLATRTSAQLPDGATVPDFTFTDMNGVVRNLYAYLDSGKYVAIDVFTTWCHPCWQYDTLRAMDSLYNLHDLPGANTFRVLGIEADGGTDDADIRGTGTYTVGDWTSGTVYPLMNPPAGIALNDFITYYDASTFPTLYIICPNKKAYQDTLNKIPRATVAVWEYAATLCGPVGLDDPQDAHPLAIYPNPATDYTVLYFSLNAGSEVSLSVSNVLGQVLATQCYGYLQAGDHSLRYDFDALQRGLYFFTISSGNSRSLTRKVLIK